MLIYMPNEYVARQVADGNSHAPIWISFQIVCVKNNAAGMGRLCECAQEQWNK